MPDAEAEHNIDLNPDPAAQRASNHVARTGSKPASPALETGEALAGQGVAAVWEQLAVRQNLAGQAAFHASALAALLQSLAARSKHDQSLWLGLAQP